MLEQLLSHIFQNSKLILAHSSKNSLPNNHSINHAMMMEKKLQCIKNSYWGQEKKIGGSPGVGKTNCSFN